MIEGKKAIKHGLFLVYIFFVVPVCIFATQVGESNDSSLDTIPTQGITSSLQFRAGYKNYLFADVIITQNNFIPEFPYLSTILNQSKSNPFYLSVYHKSANDFSQQTHQNGLYNSYTKLEGIQVINFNYRDTGEFYLPTSTIIATSFSTDTQGLQSNSLYFNNTKTLHSNFGFDFSLPILFFLNLKTGINTAFTNRAFETHSSINVPNTIQTKQDNLVISPYVELGVMGVSTLLRAEYTGFWLNANSKKYYQRIQFSSGIMEFFRIFEDYFIFDNTSTFLTAIANEMADTLPYSYGVSIEPVFSTTNQTIVPFSLAVAVFPRTDVGQVYIGVEGGLKSEYTDVASIYENHFYANLVQDMGEQSDWYTTIHTKFIRNIGEHADIFSRTSMYFSKTAFGNKTLLPDYSNYNAATGLYVLSFQERSILNTHFSLGTTLHWIRASVALESQWRDKDALKPKHALIPELSFSNTNETFTANIKASFDMDYASIPNIDFESAIKTTEFITLSLKVHDIINLITAQDRILIGKYVDNSTMASLSAKIDLQTTKE